MRHSTQEEYALNQGGLQLQLQPQDKQGFLCGSGLVYLNTRAKVVQLC